MPGTRGECVELCLEVGTLLSMKQWRPHLAPQRAVTCRAWCNRAQRAADPNQCRLLSTGNKWSGRECREMRRQIGDLLVVECSGHALHERILPLAGTIIVELFIHDVRRNSGEVRKGVCRTDPSCAMTSGARDSYRASALGVAGGCHAHGCHV